MIAILTPEKSTSLFNTPLQLTQAVFIITQKPTTASLITPHKDQAHSFMHQATAYNHTKAAHSSYLTNVSILQTQS